MTLVAVADVPDIVRAGRSDADVEAALSWASSQVEAYCERSFAYVEDDVVLIDPWRDRASHLPNPPVAEVSKVEAWVPSDGVMAWVELTNYAHTAEGLLYDTTGLPGVEYVYPSWPVLPKSLRVTYSHGFQQIPQPIVDAVIAAVAVYFADPSGALSMKQVDDVRYQWSGRGAGNTGLDENLLSPYRFVSVA